MSGPKSSKGGTSAFGRYFLKRLAAPGRARKLFVERLTEPLHLNAAAACVSVFGSYRQKVDFDLVIRPQYAFPILYAADLAKRYGFEKITIAEFGVASGAGLINMCRIASSTAAETGVDIEIVGFDTGTGMPEGIDYRDHPEHWLPGDFPIDAVKLERALPSNARLLLGHAAETIPSFLETHSPQNPLGFVSVDVDYYSSCVEVLKVFEGAADTYLPYVTTYLDDTMIDGANPWCGEYLAVNEFNAAHELRKLAPFSMLRAKRIFKNPIWLDQIYIAHIFDHEMRTFKYHQTRGHAVIPNEWIE